MNRRQFCTAAAAGVLAACAGTAGQPEKTTVYIIHGYGATPENHWFPWLGAKLREQGIRAVAVPLPDSESPDFARWQQTLAQYVGQPSPRSIFVAHSLGTVSLLHYLSAVNPPRIGGLVLVSAFAAPIPTLPEINGFNVDAYIARCRVDFAAVRRMSPRIELFSADNDTIVPPDNTRRLAAALGGRLHIIPGGGHFLDREGFSELPPVLRSVEEMAGSLKG